MPITQAKHLELLEAAEDLGQALSALEDLIARQYALGQATGRWASIFEELAIMGNASYLLKRPSKTRLTIEMVRAFYSPTRLGINRRAKNAQARRRAKSASHHASQSPNDQGNEEENQ